MLRASLSVIEVVGVVIKVVAGPSEMVAVNNGCAVGDVGVVVVDHVMVMPVASPMVPAPGETGKEADPEAYGKTNSRPGGVESRIPIPTWPSHDRWSIDNPRIVRGYVDHFRLCGLNDDRLGLRLHFHLLIALQIPRFLRTSAHRLHRIHYVLRLVCVSISQRGSPGEVLVHVGQHGEELR